MSNFSTSWKSSKKPKKQRKYLYNAPLHIKAKFLHAHLSDELAKKTGKKAIRVRTGDKVKVMKGQFKGIVGDVEKVFTKTSKVYINGVEIQKKDGTKVKYPIHASNIMIIEMKTSDKLRLKN
ncbi:MAG: 50S ribosomal protein L24 [Candidatus Woesearchaeota archaeon]